MILKKPTYLFLPCWQTERHPLSSRKETFGRQTWYLLEFCNGYFSHCGCKTPDRSSSKREGMTLAHNFRGLSPSWQETCGRAGRPCAAGDWSCPFSHFDRSRSKEWYQKSKWVTLRGPPSVTHTTMGSPQNCAAIWNGYSNYGVGGGRCRFKPWQPLILDL